LMHPVGGLDHLLAMIGVGLWASQLGGRAIFIVPAAFVGMMMIGGVLALNGMALMWVESIILASVVFLGAIVAMNVKTTVLVGALVVGAFAVFHGYAHGLEMPLSAEGMYYSAGFALATSLLHAAGIGIGLGVSRYANESMVRYGGGAILLGGFVLATV